MLEGLEQDVARDHEHRDTAPLDGTTHRDVENVGELSSCAGQLAVDAAFAEQLLRVGLLEVVAADLGAGDVGRDRKHRNPAAIGVKQPVDQVQVPWPAAARADRELARHRGFARGGERGRLLVTHVLPGHAAVTAQRVREAVQRIPRQPVDAADTGVLQGLDDEVRHRA